MSSKVYNMFMNMVLEHLENYVYFYKVKNLHKHNFLSINKTISEKIEHKEIFWKLSLSSSSVKLLKVYFNLSA